MMDLTGFRPFSLKDFAEHLTPGIYQPMQLIIACQVKHLGFVDGKPVNKGASFEKAFVGSGRCRPSQQEGAGTQV